MQRLALVLCFAIAVPIAACKKSSGPTTPAGPNLPVVTEAPLTKDSLITFVKERFPEAVADGSLLIEWGSEDMDVEVIGELGMMGVKTTGQLNAITPVDFQTKGFTAIKAAQEPTTNITGLMRDLMLIRDAKKYLAEVWRRSWFASGPQDFPAPVAYGVDMTMLEEAGVFGEGGDEDMYEGDYGDPCGGEPCGDPCGD